MCIPPPLGLLNRNAGPCCCSTRKLWPVLSARTTTLSRISENGHPIQSPGRQFALPPGTTPSELLHFDLHFLLCLLCLCQVQFQNTIVERGIHFVSFGSYRELHGSRESAILTLREEILFLFDFLFLLLLSPNSQQIAVDRDVQLISCHSRYFGPDYQFIFLLEHFEARGMDGCGHEPRKRTASEKFIHELLHFMLQRRQTRLRTPF